MVDYIIIFSEEQMLKSSPAKSILVRLYLESVHTFTRLTVSAALETSPKCVKVNIIRQVPWGRAASFWRQPVISIKI